VNEKELFTNFWVKEAKTTGKVISRIPEGSAYRPDERSRTAQEIAWQIYCEEKMIIEALENGTAKWDPPPIPTTMKERTRAIDADDAVVMSQPHDEKLRRRLGCHRMVCLFGRLRSRWCDVDGTNLLDDCISKSFSDRIRVVQPGFSACHAKPHARAALQIFVPSDSLHAPFQLVKGVGVKLRNSHNYPARSPKRKIRFVERRDVAVEGYAALDHLGV